MSDSFFPTFGFDKSDHVREESGTPKAPTADNSAPEAGASALGGAAPDENKPAADQPATFSYSESQPNEKSEPKLGDGVPEAVRELREQRKAEFPFYDDTKNYGRDVGLEDSFAAAGITDEQHVAESKRMLADFSLNSTEAKEVVSMMDHYGANPPDEETQGKWAQESWGALVRQYGAKDANAMLADAQKLVARDPRVKALLEVTRLGNHPKLVAKLVALARTEKGRGRLK